MHRSRVLLLLVLLLWAGAYSQAKVFIVTDTADSTGIQSLRGAVIVANRLGGRNTILLRGPTRHDKNSPLVFHLTIPGANEDHARTGDLDITRGDLTILGSSTSIIVDASQLGDRVFQVFPRAHLSLANLTIAGGTAPDSELFSESQANGGAVYNDGFFSASVCNFTANKSGSGTYVEGNGGGTSGGDGGAIYNSKSGTVTLTICSIQASATGDGFDGGFGGLGGGLANDGTCTLLSCYIAHNRSGAGGPPGGNFDNIGGGGGNGGALFNSGTMVLTKCLVEQNATGSGGGAIGNGGAGGGIYNVGRLSVNDSTIDGNTSGNGGNGGAYNGSFLSGLAGFGGGGGGIFNLGTLNLNTCTVSSNFCGHGGDGGSIRGGGANGGQGGSGAGIYNGGTSILTSCTLVLNTTGNGGNGGDGYSFLNLNNVANGGDGGSGAGVFNATTSSITLRNTLIALNTLGSGGQGGTTVYTPFPPPGPTNESGNAGLNGVGADLDGNFTSGGFNLVGALDIGAASIDRTNADLIGSVTAPVDPVIGPLQDNGGPTPTHALFPSSPAVDQGNSFKISTDQRGVRRPVATLGMVWPPGGDGCDIGAFELSIIANRN